MSSSCRILSLLSLGALAACSAGPRSGTVDDVVRSSKTETPQPGEGCENPIPIEPGTTTGSTEGAGDDTRSSCDENSDGPGHDLVYVLDVTEPSSLRATVTGYDAVISLFDAYPCRTAQEVACSDGLGDSEELVVRELAVGQYFLAIGTYIGPLTANTRQDAGAAFALTIELSDSVARACEDDEYERSGTDSPSSATDVGHASGVTEQLRVCPGDSDWFLVSHLGGDFAVGAAGVDGAQPPPATLYNALVDEDALASGRVELSVGEVWGSLPVQTEMPAGYYYVEVGGSALPDEGLDYTVGFNHACAPDDADHLLAELDDASVRNAQVLTTKPDPVLTRNLCGVNEDSFVLFNAIAGDVTVTVQNGWSFSASLSRLDGDPADPVITPLVDGSDFLTEIVAGVLELTIPSAPAGPYLLTLVTNSNLPVDYSLDVDFAATPAGAVPGNDRCDDAIELPLGIDQHAPISGQTVSATNTMGAACAPGSDAAPDLFYRLTVANPADVEIVLDTRMSQFFGAVSVYEDPNTCPSDLETLQPALNLSGEPVCMWGTRSNLRLPSLAAGSYLVVVDGIRLGADVHSGAFQLSATAFTAGFPEPTACSAATALSMPTAETPTVVSLDTAGALDELNDYGSCTDGGSGPERAFVLSPSADTDVVITTDGYDTVLSLWQAQCATGIPVGCNDDGPQAAGLASRITASLQAGSSYYVVVDGWGAMSGGVGSLTIELEE